MAIGVPSDTGLPALIASFAFVKQANIIFTAVVLSCVAVRIYVRARMLRTFGPEDWAMVVTTIFYCVFSGILLALCILGKRLFLNQELNLIDLLAVVQRVGNGFFALTMIALRWSVGLFFLNLIGHKPLQRYTIYAILAITTSVGMVYFGLATFTCALIKDLGLETCRFQTPSTIIFAFFSGTNIISDFTMTFIALRVLVKAQLPLYTKIVAGSLLSLGAIGGVASIVRLAIVLEPVQPAVASLQGVNSGFWSFLELAVGILAANLAMIRPLLQLVLEKLHLVTIRSITATGAGTGPISHGQSKNQSSRVQRSQHHDEEDILRDQDDILLSDMGKDDIRKETVVIVSSTDEKGIETLHGLSAAAPRSM